MNEPHRKAPLQHQDLLLGSLWHVPRDLTKPISTAVAHAIAQSAKEQVWVFIEGTPYALKADHQFAAEGNASVHIANRAVLGNGKVPAQTLLYSAVLGCELATFPLAWRFIFNEYLGHMLVSNQDSCFNAPKTMLRAMPQLCGFARTPYPRLTKHERNVLLTIVWVSGLELLRICENGVQTTKAGGAFPLPDPDVFIELRD